MQTIWRFERPEEAQTAAEIVKQDISLTLRQKSLYLGHGWGKYMAEQVEGELQRKRRLVERLEWAVYCCFPMDFYPE